MQFQNKFKFPNNGMNKFILLWRKGVYPNEYMYEWNIIAPKRRIP